MDSRVPRVSDEIAALRALVAEEGDVGALQHLLAEEGAIGNGGEGDAVLVSTVHAFKGNEADVVFLAGLAEGVFPHRLSLAEGEEGLRRELRAFYVGLTRARSALYLSASCEPVTSRGPGGPSRFLSLIPPHLLRMA